MSWLCWAVKRTTDKEGSPCVCRPWASTCRPWSTPRRRCAALALRPFSSSSAKVKPGSPPPLLSEHKPWSLGLLCASEAAEGPCLPRALQIWQEKQGKMIVTWGSMMAQMVKNPPAVWETWVGSLGWEDPLEEGMATHSSILAWRTPWTKEPGELQSMGSQRLRHDWAISTAGLNVSVKFLVLLS